MSETINESGPAIRLNPGKKWYIAGPMRGIVRLNRPAFYEAAVKLRKHGHQAVNPFELSDDDSLSIRDYLKVDLPALLECDGVALLPGWETSQGARVEALVAFECGLDVRTIHCAVRHGYVEMPTADTADVNCIVTRDEVLKAFGMPDGLSQADADASESVLKMILETSKVGRPPAGWEPIPVGPKRRENILEEAQRITSRDRQDDYGHPVHHFQRTIDAINAIFKHKLRVPFVATDWPLILVLDKVSRESNKHKRDNLTDIAGYARTAEMIHDRNEEVRP